MLTLVATAIPNYHIKSDTQRIPYNNGDLNIIPQGNLKDKLLKDILNQLSLESDKNNTQNKNIKFKLFDYSDYNYVTFTSLLIELSSKEDNDISKAFQTFQSLSNFIPISKIDNSLFDDSFDFEFSATESFFFYIDSNSTEYFFANISLFPEINFPHKIEIFSDISNAINSKISDEYFNWGEHYQDATFQFLNCSFSRPPFGNEPIPISFEEEEIFPLKQKFLDYHQPFNKDQKPLLLLDECLFTQCCSIQQLIHPQNSDLKEEENYYFSKILNHMFVDSKRLLSFSEEFLTNDEDDINIFPPSKPEDEKRIVFSTHLSKKILFDDISAFPLPFINICYKRFIESEISYLKNIKIIPLLIEDQSSLESITVDPKLVILDKLQSIKQQILSSFDGYIKLVELPQLPNSILGKMNIQLMQLSDEKESTEYLKYTQATSPLEIKITYPNKTEQKAVEISKLILPNEDNNKSLEKPTSVQKMSFDQSSSVSKDKESNLPVNDVIDLVGSFFESYSKYHPPQSSFQSKSEVQEKNLNFFSNSNSLTRTENYKCFIIVSGTFLESYSKIISELATNFEIKCFDCYLTPEVDVIVDPLTSIMFIQYDLLQSESFMNNLLRKLSDLSMRFQNIWIIVLMKAEIVPNKLYLRKFQQSIMKFPLKIIFREIISNTKNICLMIQRIINHSLESSQYISWYNNYLDLSEFQSYLASDLFIAHCDFIQLFPTMNFLMAALILSKWNIKELANINEKMIIQFLCEISPSYKLLERQISVFQYIFHHTLHYS